MTVLRITLLTISGEYTPMRARRLPGVTLEPGTEAFVGCHARRVDLSPGMYSFKPTFIFIRSHRQIPNNPIPQLGEGKELGEGLGETLGDSCGDSWMGLGDCFG